MDRKELEKFSVEELYEKCDQLRLDIPMGLPKGRLIDYILENVDSKEIDLLIGNIIDIQVEKSDVRDTGKTGKAAGQRREDVRERTPEKGARPQRRADHDEGTRATAADWAWRFAGIAIAIVAVLCAIWLTTVIWGRLSGASNATPVVTPAPATTNQGAEGSNDQIKELQKKIADLEVLQKKQVEGSLLSSAPPPTAPVQRSTISLGKGQPTLTAEGSGTIQQQLVIQNMCPPVVVREAVPVWASAPPAPTPAACPPTDLLRRLMDIRSQLVCATICPSKATDILRRLNGIESSIASTTDVDALTNLAKQLRTEAEQILKNPCTCGNAVRLQFRQQSGVVVWSTT